MKKYIPVTAVAGILLVGLAIFLWQQPSRGEKQAGQGRVYFFADGFVAVDTSRSPKEYYVAQIDPALVSKVSIDLDGVEIHLKQSLPEEGLPSSIVASERPDAGRVGVLRKRSNLYFWAPDVAIDVSRIEDLLARQDWDGSVGGVLD